MKLSSIFVAAACFLASASAVPIQSRGQGTRAGKWFDRVITIVMENKNYKDVIADPFFSTITSKYNARLLTNYNAPFHPSQPNYLGMITGGRDAWTDLNVDVNRKNLVDLLEAGGVSWKTYQENYPGNCFAGDSQDKLYRRKHNPFISMNNIRNDPSRCANIVDSSQLEVDIAAGTAPQYIFYTPNMDNDGHDTPLSFSSDWAKGFFQKLFQNTSFLRNTLIVFTWDEQESYLSLQNKVATYLIGDVVNTASAGKTDETNYSHYSLLRTIEDNWNLGNLGREDTKAVVFKGLNKPQI
ncbi:uncharacterized protein SPPG_08058 [Spizellomyces punctatus DAOM BR117]|uniref:Acid phosphatase n=1 Tax=Spizellomyces punctatus (strain DAOM BR117) TaxID=645134 RepID=A0A0L0H5H2_SPIPD|nr:uncharacterized protein SPPG_08058 [Spizellomyces punctatus DAOM BR117]KNC96467.1 hypothetical protein SPPG_08058 [Spizellomyces punctatus DAOM BR117]|eukprot:XP_016604507.1 hypothetical protein SPPG_08058 [Spizellomyces punctatus DAOM BR117]